eukprot:gene2766-12640_t
MAIVFCPTPVPLAITPNCDSLSDECQSPAQGRKLERSSSTNARSSLKVADGAPCPPDASGSLEREQLRELFVEILENPEEYWYTSGVSHTSLALESPSGITAEDAASGLQDSDDEEASCIASRVKDEEAGFPCHAELLPHPDDSRPSTPCPDPLGDCSAISQGHARPMSLRSKIGMVEKKIVQNHRSAYQPTLPASGVLQGGSTFTPTRQGSPGHTGLLMGVIPSSLASSSQPDAEEAIYLQSSTDEQQEDRAAYFAAPASKSIPEATRGACAGTADHVGGPIDAGNTNEANGANGFSTPVRDALEGIAGSPTPAVDATGQRGVIDISRLQHSRLGIPNEQNSQPVLAVMGEGSSATDQSKSHEAGRHSPTPAHIAAADASPSATPHATQVAEEEGPELRVEEGVHESSIITQPIGNYPSLPWKDASVKASAAAVAEATAMMRAALKSQQQQRSKLGSANSSSSGWSSSLPHARASSPKNGRTAGTVDIAPPLNFMFPLPSTRSPSSFIRRSSGTGPTRECPQNQQRDIAPEPHCSTTGRSSGAGITPSDVPLSFYPQSLYPPSPLYPSCSLSGAGKAADLQSNGGLETEKNSTSCAALRSRSHVGITSPSLPPEAGTTSSAVLRSRSSAGPTPTSQPLETSSSSSPTLFPSRVIRSSPIVSMSDLPGPTMRSISDMSSIVNWSTSDMNMANRSKGVSIRDLVQSPSEMSACQTKPITCLRMSADRLAWQHSPGPSNESSSWASQILLAVPEHASHIFQSIKMVSLAGVAAGGGPLPASSLDVDELLERSSGVVRSGSRRLLSSSAASSWGSRQPGALLGEQPKKAGSANPIRPTYLRFRSHQSEVPSVGGASATVDLSRSVGYSHSLVAFTRGKSSFLEPTINGQPVPGGYHR